MLRRDTLGPRHGSWASLRFRRIPHAGGRRLLAVSRPNWREAFAAHPRIGNVASLRAKFADSGAWSAEEQAGAGAADDATLAELAEANRQYEQTFGYIFIVCATGKSADEMLAALRQRLTNDSDTETRQAAGEQLKITRLRLRKLVS